MHFSMSVKTARIKNKQANMLDISLNKDIFATFKHR